MSFKALVDDAARATGTEQIEGIISVWEFVVNENQDDKDLVTDQEWKSWTNFQESTENKMRAALEDISKTGVVSTEQQKQFVAILKQVTSAKRVTTEELSARKTNLQKDANKKAAKNLLSRLRRK